MILRVELAITSRLDRYLKRLYPKLTQGVIERALRVKQIMVNSSKVAANLRLNTGDEIFINDNINILINILPNETSSKVFSASAMKLANKIISDYLIYQNQHIMAINKPAGLATQGGSKISLSIDEALHYLNSTGNDLKLVHRLDKDTSGILLIAKNYPTSVKLMQAFQKKIIQKTYLAMVFGSLEQDEGEIAGIIGKNKGGAYQSVRSNAENGKMAITRYKLLKRLANDLSLIEFTPLTGRMHQLRFHAKMLGCPIIGDDKYGNIKSRTLSGQMLLHAKKLILPKEVFGEELIINSDLPNYFVKFARINQEGLDL
jgi:23S rRNA pseudouridine955/2504/2580 synthase